MPPGTYRIAKPIKLLAGTFLIGDALEPPTLLADPSLGTDPVIDAHDDHLWEGERTVKSLYIVVRNFKIDTTAVENDTGARAMDWSVDQGCSLVNVQFVMPKGSKHTGLTMERGGSGLVIADCVSLLFWFLFPFLPPRCCWFKFYFVFDDWLANRLTAADLHRRSSRHGSVQRAVHAKRAEV